MGAVGGAHRALGDTAQSPPTPARGDSQDQLPSAHQLEPAPASERPLAELMGIGCVLGTLWGTFLVASEGCLAMTSSVVGEGPLNVSLSPKPTIVVVNTHMALVLCWLCSNATHTHLILLQPHGGGSSTSPLYRWWGVPRGHTSIPTLGVDTFIILLHVYYWGI